MSTHEKLKGQCALCDHMAVAFPELVGLDTFGEKTRRTFLWGMCSDHAQAVPLTRDNEHTLDMFDRQKPAVREAHEARYGFMRPIVGWELEYTRLESPRGQAILAAAKTGMLAPPKLEPFPIMRVTEQDMRDAEREYGVKVLKN